MASLSITALATLQSKMVHGIKLSFGALSGMDLVAIFSDYLGSFIE